MLDPRFAEACFLHPTDAVRAGVVETSGGFDKHIEAHQQAEGIFGAIVVDERFVDNESSAGI
jgi:hypothetical protein